jgi:MarR family transcriptional regulator, lower aerobic nicotinate degradation pathway regulator
MIASPPQKAPRRRSAENDSTRQAVPGGLSTWISFLAGRLVHAARADFQARLTPLGITPKQFSVLTAIREVGASSQVSLGKVLGVDRNTIVLLVDALEKNGLVRRAHLESDRRSNSVTITQKGVLKLKRAEEAAVESERKIYAQLSRSEREQLRSLLSRIVAGLPHSPHSG